LQERDLGPQRPQIAVHPFSRWKYRSWPIDEFKRLIGMLRSELECDIVVICHESENDDLLPLRNAFDRDPRVRFFPSTDLLETAAVLQDVELFIGNDSGPIHLAALLNLPVVGLYGPAPPALAAPPAASGTFLYHPVPCSPCSQTECVMPERHCMRLITAEEVLAAVLGELTMLRTRGKAANA
jgi:ADP-heptose:LPS heptosyltransferase